MKKGAITLRRLSVEWLENRRLEVKESTISHYRYTLDHYLLPDLGRYKTDQINTERILQYSREMESRNLKAATVNKALVILGMILKYVAEQGHPVADRNAVRLMKKKKKNISILTNAEQTRLLEYLMDESCPLRPEIRAGILLSLCAGLRIGEVCALRWKNIDFGRGMITVEHTLSRIYMEEPNKGKKTRIEISDPKTENSRREIPMAGFLKDEIRKLKGDRYVDPGFYVLTRAPWPMEPRTYTFHFTRAKHDTGIVDCNYHMLRHTFATKCIEAGFDIKALSEILGHSDVSTTLSLYAHPTMEMKISYMEKLGGVYGIGSRSNE